MVPKVSTLPIYIKLLVWLCYQWRTGDGKLSILYLWKLNIYEPIYGPIDLQLIQWWLQKYIMMITSIELSHFEHSMFIMLFEFSLKLFNFFPHSLPDFAMPNR